MNASALIAWLADKFGSCLVFATFAAILLAVYRVREHFRIRRLMQGPLAGFVPADFASAQMPAEYAAEQELRMREHLERERDARWARLERLRHAKADLPDAPGPLRAAYLDADCALSRALKAESISALYKQENPRAFPSLNT